MVNGSIDFTAAPIIIGCTIERAIHARHQCNIAIGAAAHDIPRLAAVLRAEQTVGLRDKDFIRICRIDDHAQVSNTLRKERCVGSWLPGLASVNRLVDTETVVPPAVVVTHRDINDIRVSRMRADISDTDIRQRITKSAVGLSAISCFPNTPNRRTYEKR